MSKVRKTVSNTGMQGWVNYHYWGHLATYVPRYIYIRWLMHLRLSADV